MSEEPKESFFLFDSACCELLQHNNLLPYCPIYPLYLPDLPPVSLCSSPYFCALNILILFNDEVCCMICAAEVESAWLLCGMLFGRRIVQYSMLVVLFSIGI
ncbi:Uncharacterised protein [Bacteroides thetaiotaomicron]|uniref:Uncharacterized protein n=1 Tax=Bacteroides thetaiotaomicron TaxID=818 RepID=A0A174SGI9_BACT4|nr:Uncharacterised protein [Bacteroides thetaiotaomicron]